MNEQMFMMIPGIQPEELMLIKDLTRDMTDRERQQFVMFYQGKRKDQQSMLIFTLIGFFGVAGIQRFIVGETVMGIVFLLTVGFCGIGTIIDVINIKSITMDFNQKQAIESANLVRMMGH